MLLYTDCKGWNVWHIAAYCDKLDVVQEIFQLAKMRLTKEDIKNDMLLRTYHEGRNEWNIALYIWATRCSAENGEVG